MAYNGLFESIRTFFGFSPTPPRNDFRNPIWSSDDEDDGDELYTRQQNMDVFEDASNLNQEFRKQMQDMVKTFGSLFGEFKILFNEDHIDAFTSMSLPEDPESERYTGKNIRDYYLKPGYNNGTNHGVKEDIDLDGKISSQEIAGLLKHQNKQDSKSMVPFNGDLVPGRSFCQTIITTSVTKPDGSIETRRIVKKGNEVIEETTISSGIQDTRGQPGLDQVYHSGFIYNNILPGLSSLFHNYH